LAVKRRQPRKHARMRWREGGESARETTIATMVTLGEVEIKLVFSRIKILF